MRGQAPGDLAHRREQRKVPVRGLHRLVGDRGRAGGQDRLGLRPVGREVEVGEHRQVGVHQRVLRRDRLLHLEQQLAGLPHVGGVGHDLRAGDLVGIVGEPRPGPGTGLDQHLAPEPRQVERAGRRQRDPTLGRLDLFHYADLHLMSHFL
jgi:hypothetical protein